jgi:hypothetical protein
MGWGDGRFCIRFWWGDGRRVAFVRWSTWCGEEEDANFWGAGQRKRFGDGGRMRAILEEEWLGRVGLTAEGVLAMRLWGDIRAYFSSGD